MLGTPAEAVCYATSGEFFLYQDRKGFEDEWRKHHTSSITRDIWLYNPQTGKHTNLTNRGGEDRNPVYAPDGNTVYFFIYSDRLLSFASCHSVKRNADMQHFDSILKLCLITNFLSELDGIVKRIVSIPILFRKIVIS